MHLGEPEALGYLRLGHVAEEAQLQDPPFPFRQAGHRSPERLVRVHLLVRRVLAPEPVTPRQATSNESSTHPANAEIR